ncbi:MAG: efflux RND transporter periplasmic adaptor subunit [Alphaproteobacteria bacterium]|nr:efflux RND transporter periplasmic adaptor subunit [Alphaproteobacteria bacterium]
MRVPSTLRFTLLLFLAIAASAPAIAQNQSLETQLEPRGVVSSRSKAVIASELVARLKSIPFTDGDHFQKGDTLLEFDCRRYRAELDAALAEQRAAHLNVRENSALRRHKAVGANELEISRAKFAQAKAAALAIGVRMSQCKILAPFSGRIIEKLVNEFEIPKANEPLLRIIDHRNLEIELIIPSQWLSWLNTNHEFSFIVDETQNAYSAKVHSISAAVDPISQTIRVKGEFLSPPDKVLPGMSGTARFKNASALAQQVPKG